MIDPENVPDVSVEETLARYILDKKHIRSDQSIRPNAFMPPVNLELSVTRHLSATDEELWSIGDGVASSRGLILYGRADVEAKVCADQSLSIRPDPIPPDNPNHAVVCDWPDEKPSQKIIAQEIAAVAKYAPRP